MLRDLASLVVAIAFVASVATSGNRSTSAPIGHDIVQLVSDAR